jgi:hypothetical protein|nr:MAG TPA: protein of unknown function (DUF4313) [Caudoviricetes sp.]
MGMTMKASYGTYEDVVLRVSKYMADESIAVMAENQQDGPIATITVCLCDKSLGENEAYIDTNNCPWAMDFIKEYKLGTPTGRTGRSGFCEYPVVKFDTLQLKLYGMEE